MQNRLWVISSFFNYFGSPYRAINFREFRRKLQAPLILVEYSLNEKFELGPDAADIYVSITGDSLIWQKERLLNHALQFLPDECEAVAWIDCDVVFPRGDQWVDECLEKLSTHRLLQVFNRVIHLPKHSHDYAQHDPEQLFYEYSLAGSIGKGADIADALYVKPCRLRGNVVNGMAWAADRELLQTTGLYDACIVGGGDTALASAAFGRFIAAIEGHRMNPHQEEYYLSWANKFWSQVGGRVSYLDQDIFHLWHGPMGARKNGGRHPGLSGIGYDPASDIEIGDNGAWKLAGNNPELPAYLSEYFGTRDRGQEADQQ